MTYTIYIMHKADTSKKFAPMLGFSHISFDFMKGAMKMAKEIYNKPFEIKVLQDCDGTEIDKWDFPKVETKVIYKPSSHVYERAPSHLILSNIN